MTDIALTRQTDLEAGTAEAALYVASVADSPVAIENGWRLLELVAKPLAFQSLTWCRTWLDIVAAADIAEDVRIVTVERQGVLVLVWPLALKRVGGCRILHQLGEPATQYCDAMTDPRHDPDLLMRAAWDLICSWKEVDVVELRRVRADAAAARLPSIAGRSLSTNECSAPLLEGTSAGFARRSGKTINALRRHQKKLAENGPVGFEFVEDAADKVRVLQEGLVFKRQWLVNHNMWSNGYFHTGADKFSLALAQSPDFHLCRLTVAGNTAAIEAGLVLRNRYWSMIQSYDERYACHGPGRLLMWQFLDRCPQIGITCVDFLAPAHEYKLQWATAEVPVRDYVFSKTMKGIVMAHALISGRRTLKRVFDMLPEKMKRAVVRRLSAVQTPAVPVAASLLLEAQDVTSCLL